MFSTNEILDMAIKLEKNGEAVYRSAIEKVPKPELAALLEWMADEEAKHADWFSNLKLNLEENRADPFMEEMSRELFNDLLGDSNFSLKDVDFSSIDNIDDLIAVFLEFEKNSHFPSSLMLLQKSKNSEEYRSSVPGTGHIHFFPIKSTAVKSGLYFSFISFKVFKAIMC